MEYPNFLPYDRNSWLKLTKIIYSCQLRLTKKVISLSVIWLDQGQIRASDATLSYSNQRLRCEQVSNLVTSTSMEFEPGTFQSGVEKLSNYTTLLITVTSNSENPLKHFPALLIIQNWFSKNRMANVKNKNAQNYSQVNSRKYIKKLSDPIGNKTVKN